VDAYRAALEVYTRADAPQQWAMLQTRLGTALQDEARHAPGEEGRALLAQAVQAYRAALQVYTRAGTPQRWARTQNNLGTALEEQGNRSPGEDGRALLAQAAQAYQAAAEVSMHATPWNLQWHLDNAPSGF
jgi:tetratricopeptide (TPR) repeat protein